MFIGQSVWGKDYCSAGAQTAKHLTGRVCVVNQAAVQVTALHCQLRPRPEPPPETSLLWLLSPLLAQHPPLTTCPQQSANSALTTKSQSLCIPVPEAVSTVHPQSRSFLTVWDLLPRAPHSERTWHCWVRKNPLQLCQLYKVQHFLFLRFILSHPLGETSFPHI